MLTQEQFDNIELYRNRLDDLCADLDELNGFGRIAEMPPLTLRCAGSSLLFGENFAHMIALDKLLEHMIEIAEIDLTCV